MSNSLLYGSTGVLGATGLAAAYVQYKSPKSAHDWANSDIMPEKRGVKFVFDKSDIANWNGYGRFTSIFMNSLSIFFPEGEAFFVRAVQAHKDKAGVNNDEKLKKQVQAFVAQESVHGREHDRYNKEIKAQYPVMKLIETAAGAVLNLTENGIGTGLMGGSLLECPTVYSKGDPKIGLVWHWHAMEETEHKAVAFDVYSRAYGYNIVTWIEKAIALVLSTVILWTLVWAGFILSVAWDGTIFNVAEWIRLLRVQWGFTIDGEHVGVLRHCIVPFFTFFHPAYHPWKWSPPGEQEKLQQSLQEFEKELEEYYDGSDAPDKPDEAASGDQPKPSKKDAAEALQDAQKEEQTEQTPTGKQGFKANNTV